MSINSIANALKEGFQESMEAGWTRANAFFAETVELRHDPAVPGTDGFISKEEMIQLATLEFVAISKVLPDVSVEDIDVKVVGNDIVMESTMVVPVPEGETLRIPARTSLTVKDEQIHCLLSTTLDLEGVTKMAELVLPVMAEAGYSRLPDSYTSE